MWSTELLETGKNSSLESLSRSFTSTDVICKTEWIKERCQTFCFHFRRNLHPQNLFCRLSCSLLLSSFRQTFNCRRCWKQIRRILESCDSLPWFWWPIKRKFVSSLVLKQSLICRQIHRHQRWSLLFAFLCITRLSLTRFLVWSRSKESDTRDRSSPSEQHQRKWSVSFMFFSSLVSCPFLSCELFVQQCFWVKLDRCACEPEISPLFFRWTKVEDHRQTCRIYQ